MKYLVIERKHNISVTGGQAVNNRLYNNIECNGHQVDYSTAIESYSGNLSFLFSNIKNIRKYHTYDRILIDSSTFPKTVWFVLLFRLFYGRKGLTTTLHHFIYKNLSGLKKKVYQLLELLFIKQCEEIIVFSPYVLDCCKRHVNKDRITYIGLPLKKDITSSKTKHPGKILYVGTIEPRKGLIFLIEAIHSINAALLANIEINIIGKVIDNNYYAVLQNKIQLYQLTGIIHFRGRISDNELFNYYETSSIFTFPSLLEGFGMVLIEAMACGLPVISFDCPCGPKNIVRHREDGLLVPSGNIALLADAMHELMIDEEKRQRMASAAVKNVERYVLSEICERWNALFVNLVHQ